MIVKLIFFQYAGDEIILTWRVEDRNSYRNATRAFFTFQDKIKSRRDHYLHKYGLIPEFKAGINAGIVTATEVGMIKKEIAYHGDTINTASRIQDQCNFYKRLVLCSERFVEHLNKNDEFETELVGEVELKGKQKPVKIYGINRY